MTVDESPVGLAALYSDIGQRLRPHGTEAVALAAVTGVARAVIPGVEWASITRGRNGAFHTAAATDPGAEAIDSIQYELGTGPCVDAILQSTTFRTGDLAADTRWPRFAQRATATTPVRSMLSFRLFLEEEDYIAGLNLYSTQSQAFDDASELVGTLVATHGTIAVTASIARERAAHLERALLSNRSIGLAMGIVMATYKVTRDQAFDLLKVASQHSNRKLVDIAADVTDTGTLDLPHNVNRRQPAAAPRPAPPRTRGNAMPTG